MPTHYSFPLVLPVAPAPNSVTIGLTSGHTINRSPFTGSAQVQLWGSERWRASISLPPMTLAQARDWQGFFARLNGVSGTFRFGDPLYTPRGSQRVVGTSAVVDGVGSKGNILATRGWVPNSLNVLRVGDYIQLAGSLYMVLNDVTPFASGAAVFEVSPRLRSPAVDGQLLTLGSDVSGVWRLASGDVSWVLDANRTMSASIEAEEAI